MRTPSLVIAVVLSAGLVCGCAMQSDPLLVAVSNEGFSVGDHAFKTGAELTAAIRTSGATDCRVVPSATAAYKQVEAAVQAVRDAGCRSGIIGNIQR